MSWEDTFTTWAKGPGVTEQSKCDNAETAIRKAIARDSRLSEMDITVFAQGSYRNKTNVRQDSDVDICVRLSNTFFDEYPEGKTRADFGNAEGIICYADYKGFVQEALEKHFGKDLVKRGDKAFDIHENTYRVDADVVAAFEYRWYTGDFDRYISGIAFNTDTGKRVTNYPEQNYANSLERHELTGRRFRKAIRILKHLRNSMQQDKVAPAADIASCLVEALVWNVPAEKFGHETYTGDIREVLAYAFNETLNDRNCKEWTEVNGIKYLFHVTQPWTRSGAHEFLSAAWDYVGFK